MTHTFFPTSSDPIARAVLTSEVIGEGSCTITIDGGGNTYSISTGILRFVDTSSDGSTFVKTLLFPGQSGITPAISNGNNFISINDTFVVTQSPVIQTYADLEDNIVVGLVITNPGTTPAFVSNEVSVSSVNIPGALYDLSNTLGPLKKGGMKLTDSGNSDLELSTTAGAFTSIMKGALTRPTTPNIESFAASTVTSYLYLYNDNAGSFTIVPTSVVQPNNWDNGSGTLATLSNNRWSVQRVYSAGDVNTMIIHFGQVEYKTFEEAALGIFTDDHIKFAPLDGSLFLGFVILKKGASDLGNTAKAFIVNPPQVNGETNTTLQGS